MSQKIIWKKNHDAIWKSQIKITQGTGELDPSKIKLETTIMDIQRRNKDE